VGLFYADFRPVEDEQVVELLERAARLAEAGTPPLSPPPAPPKKEG